MKKSFEQSAKGKGPVALYCFASESKVEGWDVKGQKSKVQRAEGGERGAEEVQVAVLRWFNFLLG